MYSQPPVPSAPASGRFDVTPYRADGGFAASGVVMLITALAIAGAVIGFIAFQVSKLFYLIILFPIVIGLVVGFVGVKMTKAGRVRNPVIGGVAGFAAGVFAMLVMHYSEWQRFKGEVDDDPDQAALVALPADQRDKLMIAEGASPEEREQADKAVAAYHGFPAFMDFQATLGVRIGKATSGSSDKGLNLGYYGSYIYWIIEVLIVAGITFAMVRSASAEPFCVGCNEWKQPRVIGFLQAEPNAAAVAVRSGELQRIVEAGPTSEVATQSRVTVAECRCGTEGAADVKLESLTTDAKGNVQAKALAHVRYPGAAVPYLNAMFAPQPTPQPLPPEPGQA